MRRRTTWLLLAALLAVSAGALCYLHCGRGVQLRLKNATNRPLRNITLHVTGRDYKIVEVAPGEVVRVDMAPTSDRISSCQCLDSITDLSWIRISSPAMAASSQQR